ncbi:helix-turn-helix domain-containing protein [Leptospira santarosai]|uniref:Helix-turn-helix domain-containing protein n=1 Tax=Leptospira santarosai TaxID=28183 RepID=A0AB73M4V3_9LEPT|nr:helix-turn-helix domain-containing protein [Leptospira santarosai]MDI7174833.1 helix-turn-helix domain-containing protein [Leptospira santarosai]MDI7193808.1 helix-turn-helix domain-containing protein [Leptospira santarosai]MDO6395566.1 helix-turn-helix domain-containing protein [Leptospira santarosai]MDO6398885.1 helix-turn-helix domain-containing protein [Leptospira santarosai]MDO6403647.1 helix-turn-helix domain-containing protein [Leptospira santarosai]
MKTITKKERPSGMDGTWIDFTIVNGLNLTDQEKILFSMIFHLSKRKEGCTAGNAYFAEIMEKSDKAISEAISRMARKGVIRVRLTKTKLGTLRVMFANVKVQKPTPQILEEATPQNEEATPYGVDIAPQNREATPQDKECIHPSNCGSDIKGIKEEHKKEIEKESFSLSAETTWSNVSEKAKDLILRELKEYDHNPKTEKSKLEEWESFQEGLRPEIVLESISKLILIKNSENFKTDTFWQSRPVNISSAYSYKDLIKNSYNALLLLSETKSKKSVETRPVPTPSNVASISKTLLSEQYASFEDWASERLTSSSMQLIRKAKSPDEFTESIRMVYNKYVNEEGGSPVLHSIERQVAV